MSGALHPQVSAAYFHSLKIFSAKSWTFVCFHLFISETRAHPALLDLLWAILLLFCNLCLCLLFLKLRPIMEVCENGKKKKKYENLNGPWTLRLFLYLNTTSELGPCWMYFSLLTTPFVDAIWLIFTGGENEWKRVRILPSPVITVVYHCCSKCGDLITLLSVRFDYWM